MQRSDLGFENMVPDIPEGLQPVGDGQAMKVTPLDDESVGEPTPDIGSGAWARSHPGRHVEYHRYLRLAHLVFSSKYIVELYVCSGPRLLRRCVLEYDVSRTVRAADLGDFLSFSTTPPTVFTRSHSHSYAHSHSRSRSCSCFLPVSLLHLNECSGS